MADDQGLHDAISADAIPADVDVVDVYVEALALFGNAVRSIGDHEWDLPTPCPEWNVRELVTHVVLGEAHLPAVLTGETETTQTAFSSEMLGTDPLSVWRGTALRAIEVARGDGIAAQALALDMGTVTGHQLLAYRITDNVVHTWDVGVAVSRPEPVDQRFAEWLLDFWQPAAADLSQTAFFGPPTEIEAGASASTRLLALLGRSAVAG